MSKRERRAEGSRTEDEKAKSNVGGEPLDQTASAESDESEDDMAFAARFSRIKKSAASQKKSALESR